MRLLNSIFVFQLLLNSFISNAQSYKDSLLVYRVHYKNEFLEDKRSPLKQEDLGWLRFYPTDKKYRVQTTTELISDTTAISIQTHSGKIKRYRRFGYLYFYLPHSKEHFRLTVYQSCDFVKQEPYKDLLFLPFTDKTNYETTYAGGRYIDLSLKEFMTGNVVIDFNKCYNPYCAYADGYNCPIPPKENSINARIKAGEKLFGKKD